MVLSGFANTLGKAERLSEESLTCGPLYCFFLAYFQKTNIIFFLANISFLHFDDGTPLMSKSRLEKYLQPF